MSNNWQLSRRSFLKNGVTGAAGLAAGSVTFLTRPQRVFGVDSAQKVPFKRFADIPKTTIGVTTVVLKEKIHVLGGADVDYHQVYDPASNSWAQKSPVPNPAGIGWGMAAPFGGRIYLFGGGYGDQWRGDERAWVYDPPTDKWSPIANMPLKRMQGAAVATENAIFIIGGHRGSQKTSREEEINVTYKYNPLKDTYTQVANMPETGIFIVSAYYKGIIYLIPGVTRTSKAAPQGYIWGDGLLKYNPAKDTWTKLNTRRPYQSAWAVTQLSSHVAIGSRLYYGGGGEAPERKRTDNFMYYDMDEDKFVLLGRMPKVRCCAGGGVVKDKLYIVAGFYNEVGDRCPETWGFPFPEESCCGPES